MFFDTNQNDDGTYLSDEEFKKEQQVLNDAAQNLDQKAPLKLVSRFPNIQIVASDREECEEYPRQRLIQ